MPSEPLWRVMRETKHRDHRVTDNQIAAVLGVLEASGRLEGCSELDWLLAQDVCIAVLDAKPGVRHI